MPESLKWKIIGTLLLILVSVYLLGPTLWNMVGVDEKAIQESRFSAVRKFLPQKGINLGLDLRGGMYLEMDVDLDEALKNRVDILSLEIERLAPEADYPGIKLARQNKTHHLEVHVPVNKKSEFQKIIQTNFGDVFQWINSVQNPSLPNVEDAANQSKQALAFLEYKLTGAYEKYLRDMTLKQAEEAVRNRIDRYGVAEASIQRQGADRIIIELPGVKDPDRVINVIRKTGLLEFRLVDEEFEQSKLTELIAEAKKQGGAPDGYSKEEVLQLNTFLAEKIPNDAEVMFEVERDPMTREIVNGIPFLVKKRADVSGDMLRNAQVGIENNEPHVRLSFNKIGTKNFGEVTKDHVGKQLAIVLDGMITTAPVIQSAILNGEAQITLGYGNYDSLLREAEDLALMLREGALPATLTIATKTVIGPSLGEDSIRQGITSLLISAVVIVLFMIGYYKLGGILASFALILNVLFLFAILALFQASLSLPGIAGIVLTMGMAVDANIIIFERMKDERRLGKTARAIIESGYDNAMSAIVDANITTLISGIVLYQFGTGPIKGFATTLCIGILTTLFTAIVVTRMVYDVFIYKRKITKVII